MEKIHLTFDDGPHQNNTPRILDTLENYKIKATFFVLGERVKAKGELLKRMTAEGHRVGNHTFNHKNLTTLADRDVINEITSTERAISQHMNPDFILRPPYGSRNSRINKIIESLGYTIVFWDVDSEDWKRKPDGWIDYGVNQINRRKESLVLMHDIHSTTAAGLSTFIEKIRNAGGTFCDLESVINIPAPGGSNGEGHVPGRRYHRVVAGETLSSISLKYYKTTSRWRAIYEANDSQIDNPDVIHAGLRLIIP